MSAYSLDSSSDSTTLAISKLCDDGSNWSDYDTRIKKAMGSKGLWRRWKHRGCTQTVTVKDGVHLLADLKTPATDEQIETKESKIIEFEKREYLAQHIILSTTLTRLGAKIKDMTSAEDMWKVVKDDATKKSTLHLLDTEEQLQSMKLNDNEDSESHLMELKQHFQLINWVKQIPKKLVVTVENLDMENLIAGQKEVAKRDKGQDRRSLKRNRKRSQLL
jgi:hypothetical protein